MVELIFYIDHHLYLLSGDAGISPYSTLGPDVRHNIEQRLRRTSDFFGSVICQFVMRDIGLLIDKHGVSAIPNVQTV